MHGLPTIHKKEQLAQANREAEAIIAANASKPDVFAAIAAAAIAKAQKQ